MKTALKFVAWSVAVVGINVFMPYGTGIIVSLALTAAVWR